MKKKINKHQHVYPTKFHSFFEAMKLVLEDERTIILTDTELHVLVNQQLSPEDRVSFKTFEAWKMPNGRYSVEKLLTISDHDASEFRQVLAYARVKQKMNLTGEVMSKDNKNQWGSTWILERKFEDLKRQPQIQLSSNPTINITAGDKEAQRMIDQMINGDIIDIEEEDYPTRRLN